MKIDDMSNAMKEVQDSMGFAYRSDVDDSTIDKLIETTSIGKDDYAYSGQGILKQYEEAADMNGYKMIFYICRQDGKPEYSFTVMKVVYDSDGNKVDSNLYERESLRNSLKDTVSVVKFTKADGSERTMQCTLDFNLIPEDQHPKPKPEGSVVKEPDPNLFKVFDMDKQAWRSFKWDTVIDVNNRKANRQAFLEEYKENQNAASS